MPGRNGALVGPFDERVPLVAQLDLPALGDLELNAIKYTAFLLKKIRVHLPFETMPAWAARSLDRKSALRSPSLFAPANHLEKLGLNLANAFHALKNQFGRDEWQRTVDYVRLGLGDRIEDVTTWADPGGGNIGLSIKQRGVDRPIPAAQLSDGTLAYLAFIALFRLNPQHPSLLALDEPDLHLHPRLLMRVLDFLETMAHENPVLVATHSDRLLDGLRDPARSVVLCELDEHDKTRLLRPNAEALERWLERYRGLGEIRGAGHEASIFTRPEDAEPRR
jgi:predicted ATPase